MEQQLVASFTISQSNYNKLSGDGTGDVTIQILYDASKNSYSVVGMSDEKSLATLHDPCPRPCPTIVVKDVP